MFKQKFAIKTLNTILIDNQLLGRCTTKENKLIAVGILRDNGYVLSKTALQELLSLNVSDEQLKEILVTVKEIRGNDVKHKTLITDFPLQNKHQLERSLVAFVNYLSGIIDVIPTMLEDDKELYKLDEIGNVITLNISTNIDNDILELFGTKIPLSLDHEEFITALYSSWDKVLDQVDTSKIVLKEILARHIKHELETYKETISAKTAIDLLRAVALISGEGNAKLDEKFKIKGLTNPIRRKLVETLDRVANIDDLVAKKGLFKTLLKLLHVHESKYEKFTNIRKLAKELQTINNPKTSRTELHKLVSGIGTKEGFDIILGNPSLFIRNLDAILRKHDADSVLELFKMSLQTRDVETKLLLQILEHFRNRDKAVQERMFTPKGKSTPVVVDAPLDAIEDEVIEKLESIIKDELRRQYINTENFFAKTYIHPSLYKINLPKGLSEQDGMKVMSRGSRYKIEEGDTLRMFVHWKYSTDIDLSAVVMNEDLNSIDEIYYGRLSGDYWEHSGDVRSAPEGGSEFVDIYLDKLPKTARYVSMNVNCYSGMNYDDIPELFGGFMMREDRLAGKKFEAKTVHDKFSITGGVNFKLIFLFDVLTREIIMINSNVESGGGWNINNVSFKSLCKKILEHKYVTVGELLELHSDYVLCEDEQLTMSEEEIEKVKVFDKEYGFDVLNITSTMM